MSRKQQFEINGLIFDSNEEIQVYLYLLELKKSKFCDFDHHLEPIVICPSQKVGKKKKTLFRELTYTPDFKIRWQKSALGLFYKEIDDFTGKEYFLGQETYIDVKGSFAGQRNSSAVSFPIKQKVVYHFLNIYVSKVIPSDLFRDTFLPDSLRLTKTGKVKTWKFNPKTLKEYLNDRRNP
jgi:hypothetical protein